jgi:pyridoxal phosphate enzyme (YggS family)
MNKPIVMDTEIALNLKNVKERIAAAAQRSGRRPSSVRLVGISKGQPIERITSAYQAGLRDFGENRVMEAIEKQAYFGDLDNIQLHMVGHIQSRKATQVVSTFDFIHSVDRLKIATRLDRFAGEVGVRMPILIECNVSGETSKGGWALWQAEKWQEILPVFATILEFQNLEVRGLMTMAPWTSKSEVLREVFGTLKNLRNFLVENLPGSWDELSMGMTDDYEIAIEEGATMVRIGRAIFGSRSPI